MVSEFTWRHAVAFHETDMAGIAHFSNFMRWMEEAEHAFLKSIDCPAVLQDGATFWGWPRVRASCEYHQPLRYGDAFEVRLFVKEIKDKAVTYFFRFFKGSDCEPVAKGEMTCVYVRFDVADRSMRAIELAEALMARICEAPKEAMKLPNER